VQDKAGNLDLIKLEDGSRTHLDQNPEAPQGMGVSFSHDSRYITWSRSCDQTQLEAIYIHDTKAADPAKATTQVTSGFYSDGDPTFDRKGEWLVFTSQRNFSPTYGEFDTTWIYNNSQVLMAVPLKKDFKLPWLPTSDEEGQKDDGRPAGGGGPGGGGPGAGGAGGPGGPPAGGGNPGDHVRLAGGPFELHGLTAGLLEDPGTRLHGGPHPKVLEGEGQIDDDQRPRDGSRHDLAVVDHLLERGGDRGGATGDDHRHTVPDEHAIHPRLVGEAAGGPVVGGDHRKRPAALPGRGQVEHGDPARRAGLGRHGGLLKNSAARPTESGGMLAVQESAAERGECTPAGMASNSCSPGCPGNPGRAGGVTLRRHGAAL
jgi:hypothetical protein